MMKSPKVSVIIPNWNGKKLLEICLASLKRQSLTDFEVIVVDNNSSDGSIKFLQEKYPDIRIIAIPQNLGFSTAVNRGIEAAKGEYVALLNNDTEVDSKWLEELCRALEENPEVGFCASKILKYHQRNIIESVGDEIMVNGFGRKIGYGQVDNGQFSKARKVFSACGAAAIYRTQMLKEIGLFDEDFFAYLEDVDLSFRAQLRGYQCLFVATAMVYHLESATSLKDPYFPMLISLRNAGMLAIKNMPIRFFLARGKLMNMLLAHLRIALFLILKKRYKEMLRMEWYILKNLKDLLHKRRHIQLSRIVSISYIDSFVGREEFSYQKIRSWFKKLVDKDRHATVKILRDSSFRGAS